MTDRSKLEALVWRRVPETLKVNASGTKFVMDPVERALRPMTAMDAPTLFEVLRRATLPVEAL